MRAPPMRPQPHPYPFDVDRPYIQLPLIALLGALLAAAWVVRSLGRLLPAPRRRRRQVARP